MNVPTIRLSSGESIPSVGFGTWKLSKDIAAEVVYQAIKGGVRHLDCACDYGNESQVGQGIRRAIEEGICKREDLWITSKLWNTYHHKEHVPIACLKSLLDLGLTYLDLYLIHFPICLKYVPIDVRYPPEWIFDPTAENPKMEVDFVSVAETWKAMEALVDANLVKSIGVSNFTVQSLMDLLSYAHIRPAVNQVEMHPYLSQPNLLAFCSAYNIHVTAFSPLGSSSYIELKMDQGLVYGPLADPVVQEIAAEVHKTPAQVILRWNIQRGVSIIPKSSRHERIVENFSLFDFILTEEQMSKISMLNRNLRHNDPGVFAKGMQGLTPIYD